MDTRTALLTSLVGLAISAAPAAAQHRSHSKVDLAVQQSVDAGEPVQHVIVTVRTQRDAIRLALQHHGDVVDRDLPRTNSFSARVHKDDVAVLADSPSVLSITADAPVSTGASTRKAISEIWSNVRPSPGIVGNTLRDTLGLPHAVDPRSPGTAMTGRDIVVATIDSGLQPNADLAASRVVRFCDFTRPLADGGPDCSGPAYDDFGHGTHVAGLIGSSGALSGYAFQGIAPNVKFVVLKVLDGTGQGSTGAVISAIDYVLAHPELRVRVLNLSLGHPIFAPADKDPLVLAVEQASAAGIACVVSAGNYGQKLKSGGVGFAGITSPGNAPSAITIGAADTKDTVARQDDRVAPFSSRGPTWYDGFAKPDLVAPGTNLVSDTNPSGFLYKSLADNRRSLGGGRFLMLSGTSMATGVASGVVALLLQANDQAAVMNISTARRKTPLAPNAVKAVLEYTAIPLNGEGGLFSGPLAQGSGEVNAAGGLVLAGNIDTSVAPGARWLTGRFARSTVLADGRRRDTYAWAQNIVWGENLVSGNLLDRKTGVWVQAVGWGDNIVWGENLQPGDNIVWGEFASDNIVWGENVVWGDNIVWGENIVWGNNLIGMSFGDNIVWGEAVGGGDNIVWGELDSDNIVWGELFTDNIVWGELFGDNIVWGESVSRRF